MYNSEYEDNPAHEGKNTDKTHKMRLSIDIHSIKECNFRGLIYAKYNSIQSLGNHCNYFSNLIGIKQYSTFPGLPIAPNTEGIQSICVSYSA